MENIHMSNQPKKIEKNKIKSTDLLKETTKNSYSSKYIEEYNRIKLNKKNASNNNLKIKFDIKEGVHSIKKNKKGINKKGINNSINKNIKIIELHNNLLEGLGNKQKTRNLSNHSFNENNNLNDNIAQKINKTTSQITLYKNIYNNQINEKKNKSKINSKENKLKTTKKNDNIKIPEIKNLSQKEKAYLILAYSKCLKLTERVIFSLSSPKLKEEFSKKQILETNKIYLKEKLDELEKKIEICDNKINSKFSASKTAEITLNFITLNIETDFKLNFMHNIEDEFDKKYFDNYVKLLYLVLGESYDEIENENLIKNLYDKINGKNYKNIKDYLFDLYIQNNSENKSLSNINKINEIIKNTPDILNFKVVAKFDKFILYVSVLLNEIINFANERNDTIKLKDDCKKFVNTINMKLNLYKRKYKSN